MNLGVEAGVEEVRWEEVEVEGQEQEGVVDQVEVVEAAPPPSACQRIVEQDVQIVRRVEEAEEQHEVLPSAAPSMAVQCGALLLRLRS